MLLKPKKFYRIDPLIQVVLNVGKNTVTDKYVSSMGGADNLMPIVASSLISTSKAVCLCLFP